MATYPVVEYPYLGSLLAVNLFSADTTILLSFFGSSAATTLLDDSARLYVGETISMGGQNYEFLGSGTAQPGIDLLGITIPTGFPQDLLLMRNLTTGDLHFVFPNGVPNATSMIALVISLDPVGYDLNTNGPLCLAKGTMVETEHGPVAVENLQSGMCLISPKGPPLTLLAVLQDNRAEQRFAANLPVVIRAGAFGAGRPARDLRLSQQHRLSVAGPQLELLFGLEWAFAPALGFVDFEWVKIGYGERPTYFHLLCDRHGLCLAEGIAVETLLWGPRAIETVGQERANNLRGQYPALRFWQRQCLPSLTLAETRIFRMDKCPAPSGQRHEAFVGYPQRSATAGATITPPCPQNPPQNDGLAPALPHHPSSC